MPETMLCPAMWAREALKKAERTKGLHKGRYSSYISVQRNL